MQTQDIEYRDQAGHRYVGFLARPDVPTGAAVLPECAGAGRGGAGLGAAVLAGMSNGEGACALGGTGLLCSVIGWLPCHGDVRG